nr:ATP-dependent zinc metalloprotease FTSH 2, chloroplastic [Ipomoea batatas]
MEGTTVTDGKRKSLYSHSWTRRCSKSPTNPAWLGKLRGLTWFIPSVDPTLISKQQLFARIVGGFGGRAAEEVIFGEPEVTTGAAGDLQRSLVWQNNGYGCLVQEVS